MKKGSIIAIFFGSWIALMFLLYWLMKKGSIIENIIYLVVVGSGIALVLWLRMRQIPQMEAVIRNRKMKRSIVDIIESSAVLILALWIISRFYCRVPTLCLPPILSEKARFGSMIFAGGLIVLILLEKLYRKYKDKVILVIMIVIVLLLIGGFLAICL